MEALFDIAPSPLPDGFMHSARWLPSHVADAALADLTASLPWQQRMLVIGGREVLTPRLTCWVGPEPFRYSGGIEPTHPWTPTLADIRDRAGAYAGVTFNSVLANLYRHGGDSMGAHRDDEPEFGPEPVIASVNLGAARDFVIAHEHTRERHVISLDHGDLLMMSGRSQIDWRHSVPRRARVNETRINLTYRQWTMHLTKE